MKPFPGPVNLIDLHHYSNMPFGEHFVVQADAVFNWRYSLWHLRQYTCRI
ncbi:hypothetical protein [[Flexibacter] sp. ATCC 35208]|nr:hypothetical protein [[Flexibacter] sp. ATCC 35208]